MIVAIKVWKELTKDERMVCLEFAAWQNSKRWENEKATGQGS